jgi:pimeloyl-ACP methyl ester carboxylesterase
MPESGGYALPLHVEEYGDGDRPIMLLHGFGATSYTWRSWIGGLAKKHKVWSVELKGHGSAPAPPDDLYSVHDHADLIRRLIVQKDLRELTLVGHSMGGGIALLVALLLLEEERLERLVLVASAAFPQRLPPFISLASRGTLSEWGFRICPKRPLIRRVLRSIVFDAESVTDTQVAAYAETLYSPAHRTALIKTAVRIIPPDLAELTKRFPEIELPTLLLWGDHDWVVPLTVAERLLAALPKARLEVMENCGHVPPEEFPKESLEVVLRFLEEGQSEEGQEKSAKRKEEIAETTETTEKTKEKDPSPESPDMSGPEEADT